jgi:hypothetical protein
LRVRCNVASLAPQSDDIVALKDAIKKMGGSDALSWQKQVAIHAQDWGQHGSWRFLPWHRLQLAYFERIVAHHSGHKAFAMPYWPWQDHDRIPDIFFDEPFSSSPAGEQLGRDAGRSDSLNSFMRAHGLAYYDVRDARLTDMLGDPDGDGIIEHSGHNIVHWFVGGKMGAKTTAVHDPIFWFHHANIDRVWYSKSLHVDGAYPADWLSEHLAGFVDESGADVPPTPASATMDAASFGYEYDIREPVVVAAAPPPPPPAGAPRQPARAPRLVERHLTMKRVSDQKGRVFVPPEVLSNLTGALPNGIQATARASVLGDAHVLTITTVARNARPGSNLARYQAFSFPMGMDQSMTVTHRLPLEDLIPRSGENLRSGFWFDVLAEPLPGKMHGPAFEPKLISFDVDFRSARSG